MERELLVVSSQGLMSAQENSGKMIMIEDKKTDLPAETQNVVRSREQTASEYIEQKDYLAAEREYRELLSEIVRVQGNSTRYHKGAPYHQIAYCLFLQGRNEAHQAAKRYVGRTVGGE
jgi:hypothetical protein